MTSSDSVVVAILASAGRPQLLRNVVRDLRAQTRVPDTIVLSVPDDSSVPESGIEECTVVFEGRGLASQRNAGMRAYPDATFYVFFDDDAVIREDYVERAIAHFEDPTIVGLTGNVLLDGAASDTIEDEAATAALLMASPDRAEKTRVAIRGLYGCNFVVRNLQDMVFFDDRLPLYSWLEDRDFAHRLGARGAIVRVQDCMIVHLGAKSGGRMAHTRLGFTQVMNPVYFLVKRSFTWREMFHEISRPLAMNVLRSFVGSSKIWRRKRLRGNAIAISYIIRRRIEPEGMVHLH